MAYAAALLAGLAGLWLWLSPRPLDPTWIAGGAVAVGLAFVIAWRMRILDGEGAPYLRAPGILTFLAARLPAAIRANIEVAQRAAAADVALKPGLVRLRTRSGLDFARAVFAGGVAQAPGMLAVDVDDDSVLIHALNEDDADEEELRVLEKSAWTVAGGKP